MFRRWRGCERYFALSGLERLSAPFSQGVALGCFVPALSGPPGVNAITNPITVHTDTKPLSVRSWHVAAARSSRPSMSARTLPQRPIRKEPERLDRGGISPFQGLNAFPLH
jgi:hypothetical protein